MHVDSRVFVLCCHTTAAALVSTGKPVLKSPNPPEHGLLDIPRPVSDAPLGGSSLPKDHGSESFFVPQNKTKKGLCTEMLLEEEDIDCRNVSLSKKHDFLLDCGVVLVSEHELKNHSDGRTVVSRGL